jgi:hypothetical protein
MGLNPSPFAPWEKGRDEGILMGCPGSCPNLSFVSAIILGYLIA